MIHMSIDQIHQLSKDGSIIATKIIDHIEEVNSTKDRIDVVAACRLSPVEDDQDAWMVYIIHEVWNEDQQQHKKQMHSVRCMDEDMYKFISPTCAHLAKRTNAVIYIRVGLNINSMTSWDNQGELVCHGNEQQKQDDTPKEECPVIQVDLSIKQLFKLAANNNQAALRMIAEMIKDTNPASTDRLQLEISRVENQDKYIGSLYLYGLEPHEVKSSLSVRYSESTIKEMVPDNLWNPDMSLVIRCAKCKEEDILTQGLEEQLKPFADRISPQRKEMWDSNFKSINTDEKVIRVVLPSGRLMDLFTLGNEVARAILFALTHLSAHVACKIVVTMSYSEYKMHWKGDSYRYDLIQKPNAALPAGQYSQPVHVGVVDCSIIDLKQILTDKELIGAKEKPIEITYIKP